MRVGHAALVAGFLLVTALAVFVWQPQATPDAAPALSGWPVQIEISQRTARTVPGTSGRLEVELGDITGPQVVLTLRDATSAEPLAKGQVREGVRLRFEFEGRALFLTVVEIHNRLLGSDYARLEFSTHDARAEIEALLRAVEESHLVFVRNRKDHDASEAVAHLRRKWQAAGDRVRTAEDFIEHVASRSSTTGEPYRVRLSDGATLEAAEWFRDRLGRHRKQGG